jgi:hypothetical protein
MVGRHFLHAGSLTLVIGFIVAAPSPSHAQSVVAVDGGVTALSDGYDSYSVFETGIRFGSLRPKRVNADVQIGTFPRALAFGALVLSSDMDVALVLPLGAGVDAMPRAGFSLVVGASGEGVVGAAGVNYGVGILARLTAPLAVRFDYTHRTYLAVDDGENVGASSLLIGIAWVH